MTLTPELQAEGFAREFVHRIQNMRRSAGFEIEDRIVTYVAGAGEGTSAVLAAHDAYIRQETLSEAVRQEAAPEQAYVEDQELDGVHLTLGVVKAS